MTAEELARYLDRIGFGGARRRDRETLAALHEAHLLTVPFENLDIEQHRPIEVDTSRFVDKVVARRRGGFCYELNGAFAELLRAFGFPVTLLSARVFNAAGELGEEFDHLALRVDLDEPWLADVGFGDGFRRPLQLNVREPQNDGWDDYRIVDESDFLLLERRNGDRWVPQYRFTLEARELSEFAPMCLFHQTSPLSPFTRKSVCSLATPDGRITLSNGKLIRTVGSERSEREVDPSEWAAILREEFDVVL